MASTNPAPVTGALSQSNTTETPAEMQVRAIEWLKHMQGRGLTPYRIRVLTGVHQITQERLLGSEPGQTDASVLLRILEITKEQIDGNDDQPAALQKKAIKRLRYLRSLGVKSARIAAQAHIGTYTVSRLLGPNPRQFGANTLDRILGLTQAQIDALELEVKIKLANQKIEHKEKYARALKRLRYMRSLKVNDKRASRLIGCSATNIINLRGGKAQKAKLTTLNRILKVTPAQIAEAIVASENDYQELLTRATNRAAYMRAQGLGVKEIGALTKCSHTTIERLLSPKPHPYKASVLTRVAKVSDTAVERAVVKKRANFRKTLRRPGVTEPRKFQENAVLRSRAVDRLELMLGQGLECPEIGTLTKCQPRTIAALLEGSGDRVSYYPLHKIATVNDEAISDAVAAKQARELALALAQEEITAKNRAKELARNFTRQEQAVAKRELHEAAIHAAIGRIDAMKRSELTYDEMGALAKCKPDTVSLVYRGLGDRVTIEVLTRILSVTNEAIAGAVAAKLQLKLETPQERQTRALEWFKAMADEDLTDPEIAQITGCLEDVVSNLRKGRNLNPSPTTCKRLLNTTRADVDAILAQRQTTSAPQPA